MRTVVVTVPSKRKSPYRGTWLFGHVQGHWDGRHITIYRLPDATEEEVALAIYHEKAHAHLEHPEDFSDAESELVGEALAWDWTYRNLPKRYRTKHVLKEIIRAVSY